MIYFTVGNYLNLICLDIPFNFAICLHFSFHNSRFSQGIFYISRRILKQELFCLAIKSLRDIQVKISWGIPFDRMD